MQSLDAWDFYPGLILKLKNSNVAKLTIEDDQARNIYPTASSELKTILENAFGKSFFSQKITDRVKNFDDICLFAGTTDYAFHAGCAAEGITKDEIADRKWKLIIKVLNEGWMPNWAENNEKKYQIIVKMTPSSFGLNNVNYYYTNSNVSSHLSCPAYREPCLLTKNDL